MREPGPGRLAEPARACRLVIDVRDRALRQALDAEGFDRVKIVASSGFSPAKCRVMAVAQAPIDVVGTGSYLPEVWSETYATADIVAYDGEPRVKVGREFLLRKG